jgi:hypothetical protein
MPPMSGRCSSRLPRSARRARRGDRANRRMEHRRSLRSGLRAVDGFRRATRGDGRVYEISRRVRRAADRAAADHPGTRGWRARSKMPDGTCCGRDELQFLLGEAWVGRCHADGLCAFEPAGGG